MTRRDFMGTAAMAAGGLFTGSAMADRIFAANGAPFTWGCHLHLRSNMWDDFDEKGPDGWAKSEEEEKTNPNPFGPGG